MKGEDLRAGWINNSDIEKEPLGQRRFSSPTFAPWGVFC